MRYITLIFNREQREDGAVVFRVLRCNMIYMAFVTVCKYSLVVCAQDEKNEMLHTNMWLNYVSRT